MYNTPEKTSELVNLSYIENYFILIEQLERASQKSINNENLN